jgi:hypothetical protein
MTKWFYMFVWALSWSPVRTLHYQLAELLRQKGSGK